MGASEFLTVADCVGKLPADNPGEDVPRNGCQVDGVAACCGVYPGEMVPGLLTGLLADTAGTAPEAGDNVGEAVAKDGVEEDPTAAPPPAPTWEALGLK